MKNRNDIFPYLLVLPLIVLFLIFHIYPIISTLILSFQTSEGGEYVFVGLSNYIRLFNDPNFKTAAFNSFIILIIQVPIMLFSALVIAVILNSKIKFRGIFRTGIYLPAVTSLVATSLLFLMLLQDNGLMNSLLSLINIEAIPWLSHPFWAKISIVITVTWRWTGYNMVIYLAGLQNIPNELYEAASIDGAGPIRQFFSITIPSLKPLILFTTIFSSIGAIQLFDEPYNLTGGGPANSTMTLGMLIYREGFNYSDFGYSSAIAYVVAIMIIILSLVQFYISGRESK